MPNSSFHDLCRLHLETMTLLVKIENFKINYTSGQSYGSFSISNFSNASILMSYSKAILEINGTPYEIILESFEKNEEELNVLCNFFVIIGEDLNCSGMHYADDLVEDDSVIEEASSLIEKFRSRLPDKFSSPAEEIAAVIAGSKPAAIISETDINVPLVALLVREAYVRGYKVETVNNVSTKLNNIHSLVIGDYHNVDEIVDTMNQITNFGIIDSFHLWQLNLLLGYSHGS